MRGVSTLVGGRSAGNPDHKVVENAFQQFEAKRPIVEHSLLSTQRDLPPLAIKHLEKFPYRAPNNVEQSSFWYEGTYDPLGPHHLEAFLQTMQLGFERATLGIVFQNPYKPNSSPFTHRYEMACRALESHGLNIVDDPSKAGVCIFTDPVKFNQHRMEVLFGSANYILIGPDNFQSAVQNNILWVHPEAIRSNPSASDYFGFRSLCENVHGFRNRVLVYPILHDLHATDIREGRVAPSEPVAEYARKHGLYQGSGSSPKPVTGKPIVPDRRQVIDSNDLLHRAKLEREVCISLGRHGMLTTEVGDAVFRTLGQLDRSEVAELERELTGVRGTNQATPSPLALVPEVSESSRFSRPIPTLRKMRDSVTDALFKSTLQTEGAEVVHHALEHGKRILFVGNHSGWGDIALLTAAMRRNGLGAVGDRVNFVVGNEVFPEPFMHSLMGRSVGRIIMPTETAEATESAETPLECALGHGFRRLGKEGMLALFPEGAGSTNGVHLFGSAFINFLRRESLAERNIDPESLVIIPWAQRGGSALAAGQGTSFSEESPALVAFGTPISASKIAMMIEAGEPASDIANAVGHFVAELVPTEHRGVYGPYAERYLSDPHANYRINASDLQSIDRAATLVATLQQTGELADSLAAMSEVA